MVRVRMQDWIVLSAVLGFSATLTVAALESPASGVAADHVARMPVRVLWTSRTGGPASAGGPHARQQADQIGAEIDRQVASGNGCLTCHRPDTLSMHELEKQISCVECHGGNAKEPWNPKNPQERVPATLRTGHPRGSRANGTRARPAEPARHLDVLGQSATRRRRVARRVRGVHPVRQSWRPACRREDVRPVSLRGKRIREEEHDDARRHAVGRRALQQRLLSVQGCAVRRVLSVGWHAGARRSVSGGHAGPDTH